MSVKEIMSLKRHKIVDTHVHCFPDAIAKKAISSLATRADLAHFTDGTREGVLKSMDAAGVDISVICNIATTPRQMHSVNDFARSLKSDRLVPLGSIHPDAPDWEEELHRIEQMGLRGIKLHPDYQDFFVDEARMIPIYRRCVELGLGVVFHAGLDLGLPSPVHCTPKRFVNVMKEVDTSRFVLAHLGGCVRYDATMELLCGQPVYLDLSFSMDMLPPERVRAMIQAHPKRMLFATDSPWRNQKDYIELVRSLNLDPAVESNIFGENALRWLRMEAADSAQWLEQRPLFAMQQAASRAKRLERPQDGPGGYSAGA